MTWFGGFVREEKGVTSIEYTLVAVLIALSIITAVAIIGGNVNSAFSAVVGLFGG